MRKARACRARAYPFARATLRRGADRLRLTPLSARARPPAVVRRHPARDATATGSRRGRSLVSSRRRARRLEGAGETRPHSEVNREENHRAEVK